MTTAQKTTMITTGPRKTSGMIHGKAFVGHDQGHLASAYHAYAGLQALSGRAAAHPGPQSAADHFREHRCRKEADRKQKQAPVQFRQLHLDTDAGEENGSEKQILHRLKFCCDIISFCGVGDYQAGGKGADDIRYPKDLFRAESKYQADHERPEWDSGEDF